MTYLIYRDTLWSQNDRGDGWNTIGGDRPVSDHPREYITFAIDDPGLTIDPTDHALASLPGTELARFGLSRATLLGTPAPSVIAHVGPAPTGATADLSPARPAPMGPAEFARDAAVNAAAIGLGIPSELYRAYIDARADWPDSPYQYLVSRIADAALSLSTLTQDTPDLWDAHDWYLTVDAIADAVLDGVAPVDVRGCLQG